MSVSTLASVVWEQNRLLLVAVCTLALFALGLFLYQGQVVEGRLDDLRIQQTKLQHQVRQRQVEHAGSGKLQSEAGRIAGDLRQFPALIPAKQQFSNFIGELFAWGDQTGLTIKEINYTPKVDHDTGLLKYGLSFSLSGDYTHLKQFIHLLENSQRILIIDQISLAGSEKTKQGQSGVQLQVQLTTYFREEAS